METGALKVAYYLEWSEGPSSGVFNKVVTQTHYWIEQELTVKIFVLSHSNNLEEWQAAVRPDIEVILYHWRTRLGRFEKMRRIVSEMMAWQPDLVYKRFGPYYPFFEKIWRSTKHILEINTDDRHEYQINAPHRYYYSLSTRNRLLNKVSGLVFVSHEVSQKPHYTRFRKPYVVVPNGIDLRQFTPLPAPNNATPHLVFIGTPGQPWHGTDKLLMLAQRFPSWHFDLIGPSISDFGEPLPLNVTAHGLMNRNEYQPVLAQADVAIGSMALHRVGIHENSPLKLPEYMAYGLPAIVGYKESNFPDEVDFLLQLPSVPNNVEANVDRIEQFVLRSMGKRVPRDAIQHIDAHHKEQQRVAFFKQIMATTD
jgi:glycosyltransferase involved in cell wall biosynthesis